MSISRKRLKARGFTGGGPTYKEALEIAIKDISIKWARSKVYYVGGYVRDELLKGGAPKDVDLVIDLPNGASEFCEFLKKEYPTTCVDFVEYPRFGTAKFTLKFEMRSMDGVTPWIREIPVECVAPRKEEYLDGPRKPSKVVPATIEEDAMRRDFCCNALYKDTVTGKILDPTKHGIEDVKNKILRTPCDPEITFKDDPLRMLRAIRFAAVKEFTISSETLKAIKPIPEYFQLSMERVESEFTQILLSQKPVDHIWTLHKTGLLGYILPEFEEAWGFNQNSKYHSMNLTDHSLSVLENSIMPADGHDRAKHHLEVRLAALLHDISKYRYHETNVDGTFSYHDHDTKSAEMAEEILKRLKYSNDTINYVCMLIKNHMGIKSQYDYATMAYTGTKKSMVKFINKLTYPGLTAKKIDVVDDMLCLIHADNLSHDPNWNMPGQINSFYKKMEEYSVLWSTSYPTYQPTHGTLPSGKEIMDRFKIPAGKGVGFLKDKIIYEFSIDHPEYDKETLLNMVDEEFGGKKIYIFSSDLNGGYKAADIDPDGSGHAAEIYRHSMPLYKVEGEALLKKYASRIKEDAALVINAIEEPELFVMIMANVQALKIVDAALTEVGKIIDLTGFKSVHLEYDNYGDARARIDWENRRPTIIY